MSNHVIKLSAITLYFAKNNTLLLRGENSFESGHVMKFHFDADLNVIRGVVAKSMKQGSYNVQVFLTDDFQVESANCECPRGKVICHHIAALLIAARENISKTDVACSWNQRATNSEEEVKTLREVYGIPKLGRVTDRDPTDEEKTELYDALLQLPPVGFRWILSKESTDEQNTIFLPVIKNILNSQSYAESSNQLEYLQQKLRLSPTIIFEVAEKTCGQSNNSNWYFARKHRITASNFGKVIAAINRNRYPPSLFTTLRDNKDLSRIKAVQWGRTHEKEGLRILSHVLKKEIKECGVFLTESGVLGASPDGIIDDDIAAEIKCPFKFRKVLLTEVLKVDKSYVFYYDDKSKLQLNKSHPYYHQVQGQLYLSGRQSSYLCVWTPKQIIYCLIHKDKSWKKNIDSMEQFFFEKFIPFLASTQIN